MKNTLFEQKVKQLRNKWHFVENKTEIMQHALKMQQISLSPKYIKLISSGFFERGVFAYANISRLKVKRNCPKMSI
jgi:hypothetical protein